MRDIMTVDRHPLDSAPNPTCDHCGLPVIICNARAMARLAAERYGKAEIVKHVIHELYGDEMKDNQ